MLQFCNIKMNVIISMVIPKRIVKQCVANMLWEQKNRIIKKKLFQKKAKKRQKYEN